MSTQPPTMFAEPPRDRRFPTAAVLGAVAAVVAIVFALVVVGHRRRAAQTMDASYAPNLVLSGLALSQSDTLQLGTVTYLEGHIQNNGPRTVTAVTVRVSFASSTGMAPEVSTRPLRLVRIREPEIDTEDVSAAPIAAGHGADFYLAFENIHSDWDGQTPTVRIVGVSTR